MFPKNADKIARLSGWEKSIVFPEMIIQLLYLTVALALYNTIYIGFIYNKGKSIFTLNY